MSDTNLDPNGVDRSFWPALRVLVERVRGGWIAFCLIISVVAHLATSAFVGGWLIAPAKTTDVDALSLRMELAGLSVGNLAIGNVLAQHGAALARIEEGLKGINVRFNDYRASAPAVPAPPPHRARPSAKKRDDGVLSILTRR